MDEALDAVALARVQHVLGSLDRRGFVLHRAAFDGGAGVDDLPDASDRAIYRVGIAQIADDDFTIVRQRAWGAALKEAHSLSFVQQPFYYGAPELARGAGDQHGHIVRHLELTRASRVCVFGFSRNTLHPVDHDRGILDREGGR